MTDMEKLLIGATIATLAGLIVWLIQVGFNDLKKGLTKYQPRSSPARFARSGIGPLTKS